MWRVNAVKATRRAAVAKAVMLMDFRGCETVAKRVCGVYTAGAMQLSIEVVRDVARLLRESGLQQLSLQDVDDATGKPFRIVVKKSAAPLAATISAPPATPPSSPTGNSHPTKAAPDGSPREDATAALETNPQAASVVVSSNAVGLLRTTTPALKTGDAVRAGQTVAIVESMKIPGEIASPVDGHVGEMLAADDQGVEYGQPLLTILPAAKL